MNKPELLCPAGDLERLQMALHFGADAVYLAGAQFGMRAGAENFTPDGIRAAVQLAHAQGAAVHVTCNTLPRDDEMAQLPAYLELLDDAGVDAIIAADLGVITLAKRYAPHVALHVSTQFGVVNSAAAAALYDLGAQRSCSRVSCRLPRSAPSAPTRRRSWSLRRSSMGRCACRFPAAACCRTTSPGAMPTAAAVRSPAAGSTVSRRPSAPARCSILQRTNGDIYL